MIGETYYERGKPVLVIVAWIGPRKRIERQAVDLVLDIEDSHRVSGKSPRNVLIRRADGTLVSRPFRGLRKNPPKARA